MEKIESGTDPKSVDQVPGYVPAKRISHCRKRPLRNHLLTATSGALFVSIVTVQHAKPRTEAVAPILAIKNIEVIYDHVILVLKGVSISVPRGGIVAILGANGAGKSTSLKAVSNLIRSERGAVTKGSIELNGERVD